jgi:peptidylprolyl isomerase
VTLLVLGCAALSVAVPLCLARYVPFVDYPDHLAQIATIANINDPRFAPYYELALGKSQYFSFYLPAALLAKMFGTEIGTRIALIAALAGLPLAVAVFLRAHGRSALPAAAAAFIGINMQAYWGFINFVEGVTLGILAVAAHAHLVNKPSTRRAVLFGLAAVVTFYAHAYAYVWLVAACFFQTLAMLPTVGMRQTLASAWRAVVAGVPSVLALFIWLHNSQVLEHGEAGGRIEGDAAVVASRPTFTPPMEMVERWIDHSFGVYVDGAGTKVATACLLAIGVLFLLRIALSRPWRKESDPAWGMGAPEAVLALSVGAYLFAPESYKLVGGINPRFIVTTFALLPVLAPIALSPRLRLAVGAGLVGLLAYCSTVHIEHFRRLDAEMGDLDQALAQTAPGKRLLGLNFDPRSAELLFLPAFLHAHQYYQSRIGGMSAWGFVELPHSPIVYRPGAAPAPFPPRFEWEPEQFDWSRWGDSFDYFLVRTQQGRNTPWSFRYDATIGRVHALFEGSRWKLYERVAAPPPQALAKVDPGPDQLIVRDVVDGTGEAAAGGSMVSIHFTRSLVDGSGPFSTHAGRGDPHVFKLGAEENLRAFNLGLVGMKVGGKRELIVPEGLGYGKAGLEPTVPPRAGLIFEVDLLGVRRP